MSDTTSGSDSVPAAVPADAADLAALYGDRPAAGFVAMDLPGHVLWDNGAYVQVHVHLGLGRWWSADDDASWARLSPEAQAEYARRLGTDFPAPGEGLIRIMGDPKSG